MADEKVETETLVEKELDLEAKAETEEKEDEEKESDEEESEESQEKETEGDDEDEQEDERPGVAAQMLAELQSLKAEIAQLKNTPQKESESQEQSSYLKKNVFTAVVEDKIKGGSIAGEHAQFYRQLGGLFDQALSENTERTDKAIASFGTGFRQVISRLQEIDYRGFKRTYGDTISRDRLDGIIKESGNPFMTYDEAMQKSVLSDPAILRQFLASQRGEQKGKKTSTPQKVVQKQALTGSTAKFREYFIKGTQELDMNRVKALPFNKRSEVLEAWGEWFDKKGK